MATRKNARSHKRGADRRWVSKVKTVSTFPPEKLFTQDADTLARELASKKVSPKGIGSGLRMLQYFINRGGKGLSASRKKVLERAKRILQEKLKARKQRSAA
jgi:tRNA(adenine34) deaminase